MTKLKPNLSTKIRSKFPEDIRRRVSRREKENKDFERAKEIMDINDMYYGYQRDYNDIEQMDINYELFNGRLDTKLYADPICFNIGKEEIKLDHQKIIHYPLISQIANAMYGEMIARPFKPLAKDIGSFAQTVRSKKWNELIQQLVQANIVDPIQDIVTSNYFKSNNIQDIRMLSPEQLLQLQSDIQKGVVSKTPKEVIDFMENDFQTPTQRQAQKFIDYFIDLLSIREEQNEGFKHALITGKEHYYVGERNGEPVFEWVNSKFFTWGGSSHVEWVQKGDWTKYERWLSFENLTQNYAEDLNRDDYDQLESLAEPIGGLRSIGDPRKDSIQRTAMYELSQDDGWVVHEYGNINIKTKEGQNKMKRLYQNLISRYGSEYGQSFSDYGVREAHFTWRDKRLLKKVERIVNDKKVSFWLDEHYEERNEDIKITEVWVDEIWEGVKLGSVDPLYKKIRPLPAQYKSIFNPYGVMLPYVGRTYNTHRNNAKNVTFLDNGKAWQKEFDYTMAQLKFDMATDVGNVFLMFMNLKPDNITWNDWMNTMKTGKMLLLTSKKHGLNPSDAQLLKSVNLSKMSDMAGKVQYLEVVRNNLTQAMYFNPARIGAIGQYATSTNTQQNQSASYNQTESWFENHRQIVEEALNQFMNTAKYLYKDKPEKLAHILDDVARTDLEISSEMWYEEIAIKYKISSEELQRIQELRANLLSFIQNGLSFDGVLALSLANTRSDIIDVFKRENAKIEKQRQETMQFQQEEAKAARDAEASKEQAANELKLVLEKLKLESQERRATIQADQFRVANDVNQNNQHDLVEKARMELLVKREVELRLADLKEREVIIKEKEAGIKSKKSDADIDRDREDLRIKEKQVNKPVNSSAKQ